MLHDEIPPPVLYKYFSPDRMKLESLLSGQGLWHSSPLSFNDPFDCLPVVDLSASRSEALAYVERVVQRHEPELSRQPRRARARDLIRKLSQVGAETAWLDLLPHTAVACLTDDPQSLLMWSHYGTGHTGFCVGFDTKAKPFILAHRVQYTENRPVYRVVEPDPEKQRDAAWRAVTHKANDWSYENEWRTMVREEPGLKRIRSDAISVIIVGARTSEEDIGWIFDRIEKYGLKCKLLRASIDPRKFAIRLRPLADISR